MVARRILILTYYFPPCNITPNERSYAYAKYLSEFGYYPTIITRNWDVPIRDTKDEYISTGAQIKHEINDKYEVYYLPYKSTLKDKLFLKTHGSKYYIFYLIVTLMHKLLENLTSYFTYYKHILAYAKRKMQEQKYDAILVSGTPFHLFRFGYKLHRLFNVPWVAEYRDDWNTSEIFIGSSKFFKQIEQKISIHSEKRWLKSTSFFVTVSEYYVQKISTFLNKKGYLILNGYMPENYLLPQLAATNHLEISYVGSLVETQPIELFVSSVIEVLQTTGIAIKVNFIGLMAQSAAYSRVLKLVQGFESHFSFTDRVTKKQAIEIQHGSDFLLACAHTNLKGIPGSKLYEYIALKKPVIICPSDKDIIETTMKLTGQGIVIEKKEELIKLLIDAHAYKQKNKNLEKFVSIDQEQCNYFSRYNQVKKFAAHLDELLIK
jgi:hypothetical protein